MPAMKPAGNEQRNSDLAMIHIAKKQLAMEDEAYRDLLWSIGRVRSAADLDFAGRKRVLEHLRKCGFKPLVKRATPATGWEWVNRASADRQPMLRKIAVILRDAGRGKAYVDAMVKRMFAVERIEFCAPDQLHAVTGALVYDQKRRAAKGAAR